MRRLAMVLGVFVLLCGARVGEAQAQVPPAPSTGAPAADTARSRTKTRRPSPTLVTQPAAPSAAAPAADTARNRTKGLRPSPTLVTQPASPGAAPAGPQGPRTAVTPQSAAAPASSGTFTAGLAIEPFSGDESASGAYFRRFTQLLDSTIATLVGVFRGTSGQPLAGATGPTSLSQRERDRWILCRNLHWDLQSYVEAMHELVESVPDNPGVQRAAGALDSTLSAVDATTECDNVASMMAAPNRWTPWGEQYTTSARHFYADWYGQVRDVAERNRAFVIALNGVLPAAQRLPVPPAMPRNPPYAGAAPR